MNYKISIVALLIGFALDLLLGDPHWLPHPVRFIGSLNVKLEKILRKRGIKIPANDKSLKESIKRNHFNTNSEIFLGGIFVLVVLFLSTVIPLIILLLAEAVHPYVRLLIESIMCYQLLATKSLKDESMKVYKELKNKDIIAARKAVSMIVGRDTDQLNEAGVAKAAVETVAENTSDGIIAPMLFMAMGGAVFGFIYKAANTMDSMVGYKNDNYLYFGRVAAKLDDVLNFIPARISAFLMIIASFLLGLDGKHAYKIFKRDRFNHASPNSAQTESVCAGALGVELAGDAYYFGKLYKKKTIGDVKREITFEDIKTANRLLYVTAFLCIFLICLCYFVSIIQ